MSHTRILTLLPVALLAGALLSGCDSSAPAPANADAAASASAEQGLHYGQLQFQPCALSVARVDAVEAQCTTLSVPENRAKPDGRQIELAIAWIPAKGEAEPDPVFMIAGGPGQSALETYPMLHGAFSDVRKTRHIILVDARGTGGSHPLACREELDENPFSAENMQDVQAARAFAETCRDKLDDSSDLRFYTTSDHIQDLDLVREKIGAETINLIGVSYGTRVALQYAKRYPQHTRTVTLDSVVPNSLVVGQEFARNLDDALARLFAQCRADAACLENLGDPQHNLDKVTAQLKSGELEPVRYRDPTTGQWRTETPTYGHLAALLRMYAYQPAAASMLPLLLHDAAQGHYESLLAQARMLASGLADSMMFGMQLSVICTEDAPEMHVDPADADTVMGTDLVAFTKAQCAVWPTGERPDDFRAPLTGDVPVLAISGENDPVTPPRYGETVISHLPNGRHLVLPGQGHNVIGAGCMPELFAQFIESANTKSLDASCLQRLQATPPFAGNYGWEP